MQPELLARPEPPANDDVSPEDREAGCYVERSIFFAPPQQPAAPVLKVLTTLGLIMMMLVVAFPSLGSLLWSALGALIQGMWLGY